MTPSSTVHFSFPTGTQFVRSFPLNSFTHCSPGRGARFRGVWAHNSTGTAKSSNARRDIVISLADSLHAPAGTVLPPDVARRFARIRELQLGRVPLQRRLREARRQRP